MPLFSLRMRSTAHEQFKIPHEELIFNKYNARIDECGLGCDIPTQNPVKWIHEPSMGTRIEKKNTVNWCGAHALYCVVILQRSVQQSPDS